MKLSRAERARLIQIDKWLVVEEVALEEAERVVIPILTKLMTSTGLGTTALQDSLLHIQLPLAHLKWLLALVKREAARCK